MDILASLKTSATMEEDVHETSVELLNGSFLTRLHAMLTDIEQTGNHASIVSWRPNGCGFIVKDKNRFVQEVLPIWFSMKRYTSFQRALNLHSFLRVPSGPDKGGYYHVLFLRGRPDLLTNITKQKPRGTSTRQHKSPKLDPDSALSASAIIPENPSSLAEGMAIEDLPVQNQAVQSPLFASLFSQPQQQVLNGGAGSTLQDLLLQDRSVLSTAASHSSATVATNLFQQQVERSLNDLALERLLQDQAAAAVPTLLQLQQQQQQQLQQQQAIDSIAGSSRLQELLLLQAQTPPAASVPPLFQQHHQYQGLNLSGGPTLAGLTLQERLMQDQTLLAAQTQALPILNQQPSLAGSGLQDLLLQHQSVLAAQAPTTGTNPLFHW